MKARQIRMDGDMVRATLDGRKTQIRPIVKDFDIVRVSDRTEFLSRSPYPLAKTDAGGTAYVELADRRFVGIPCPYGRPGDLLWVRETFAMDSPHIWYKADCDDGPASDVCEYADTSYFEGVWKPSTHMPRWASRLTLKITDVRVEQVQDISNEDALAEGVGTPTDMRYAALDAFRPLWDSIYEPQGFGWEVNPWVWVIEFEAHRMNVDKFIAAMEEAA